MKNANKRGFTLIELLVVVLIIGILASVALPQYTKAVEKSRATQALAILKSLGQAQEAYYMANNAYAQKFDDLDLSVNWKGTDKWYSGAADTVSNGDWSLQIWGDDSSVKGVGVGRLKGEYAGAAFAYLLDGSSGIELNNVICMERFSGGIVFAKEQGAYCEKLWNYAYRTSDANNKYFSRN